MNNIGVFCDEDLSNYEKTMYAMAIAFSERGAYTIKTGDISELAARFCLNDELLHKALSFCPDGWLPYSAVRMGSDLPLRDQLKNAELFEALVRVYYIYQMMSKVSDGVSYESILNNYQLFQDSIVNFEILNMTTSCFECMSNDCFSLRYAVFNNAEYQPRKQLDLLRLALFEEYDLVLDKDFLPFLCRVMSYELITRVNSVYLITINQVIKHSPFFDDKIKTIAEEMYYYLLGLAQNARVISVEANYLPAQRSDTPQCRGRRDNTTRLQVLYGYANFDAYYLRLDLVHKGQGFIHYNNKSPGGVKCCLFDEQEYHSVLAKYPPAQKFFIEYDRRYALKEPHNLELTGDEVSAYEEVRRQKEHDQAFKDTYEEAAVDEFVNVVASMLPASCLVAIDADERHAQSCFQYEKIMYYSVLLEIAILSAKKAEEQQLLHIITSLAVKYGIISEQVAGEYVCIEGVCLIIDEIKRRIALYQF